MTLKPLLQEFGVRPTSHDIKSEAIEAARANGYERGYASGWEDASQSAEDGRQKIDAEFARNIQDLGFTFHEATSHVRGELLDLVAQIAKSFLPDILPAILRETVREHLLTMMDDALEPDLQIVTSPTGHGILSELIQDHSELSFSLVVDETVAPYQVFIRFSRQEIDLNFSDTASAFETQIIALKTVREQEHAHA